MIAKTRIETFFRVPATKVDSTVNEALMQIEKDGLSVTDISYFPRDINHRPLNQPPELMRTYDIIIQWVSLRE